MVDAPRPPTLTPPGAPPLMFLSIDAGCCRTCHQHPPGGPTIDVFNFSGGRCWTCLQHPQGVHHRQLQLRWWPLLDMPSAPPRGPTIDVFNFGGGRCRTCRQHPRGGPPSMSSTSMVAPVGHAASTLRGARHRRLQLRWWPLSDLPPAPPRGATINVFNFDGGRCRTCRQHPLGGPPSTFSTSVVAVARNIDSTPRGPAVNVFFNFGGGYCWTYQQHPQGARCQLPRKNSR
jgi:hypothetical protein